MHARVAAAAAALLVAIGCAEKPAPAKRWVEPPPPSSARPIASFEVTIEPPERGPGMGGQGGRAIWTILPEGQDQNTGTNPPRTVEIVSTANFAAATAPSGCASGAIMAPVQITNYLPERLAAPFVSIKFLSDGNRTICNPGVMPTGGSFDWDSTTGGLQEVFFHAPTSDFMANYGAAGAESPYGSYVDYVNVNAYPYQNIAASPVTDGSAPGGQLSADWYFSFPTGSSGFTLRGEIWAEPFPNAPRVGLESWFGYIEQGETIRWFIYDNKDDRTYPQVTQTRASICTQPWTAAGTCGGTEYVLEDAVSTGDGFVDTQAPNFGWASYDAPTPGTLTVGQHYYVRAVAHWNHLGAGFIDGSFPLLEDVIISSKPQLQAPADAAEGVPRAGSTTFSWTVDFPYETTAPSSDDLFVICTTDGCIDLPGDVVINLPTTSAAVEGPANTWTYSVTPDLSTLAPGTTYWWSARSHLANRNGDLVAFRSFTTGP